MFRDEAKALTTKHRNQINQQKVAQANASQTALPATVVLSPPQAVVKIQREDRQTMGLANMQLRTPAEDQAACFFFKNYAFQDNSFPDGIFQYAFDLYNKGSMTDGALADSVASLGMAGLSHFWKAPTIMASARVKYNSALRQLSTRLRDIEEAKSDSTLASVMLLGLYEVGDPAQA